MRRSDLSKEGFDVMVSGTLYAAKSETIFSCFLYDALVR